MTDWGLDFGRKWHTFQVASIGRMFDAYNMCKLKTITQTDFVDRLFVVMCNCFVCLSVLYHSIFT